MTEKEAVEFCEETECEDCPVAIEDREDWRTQYEKTMLHFPCCLNLVDENERFYIRRTYNPHCK